MNATTRLRIACALGWIFCAPGCSEATDPPHYLQNLRILAAEVTPTEADPTTPLELRAYVYVPEGEEIVEEAWSVCPISLGPYANFACVDAACEFCIYHAGENDEGSSGVCSSDTCTENCFESPEKDRAQGNCQWQGVEQSAWRPTLRVNPVEFFLSCGEALGVTMPARPETGEKNNESVGLLDNQAIPEVLDIVFRYRVRTKSGQSREALVRVPFWVGGAPEEVNRPPAVEKVTVNDQPLSCGDQLRAVDEKGAVLFKIRFDETSLDTIPAPDGSGERTEDAFVTYFCTAGRFERELTDGLETESTWTATKLEEGQTEAEIHMVVRDEQGGQIVLGPYRIPINPQ